uniref:Uncharacterized protein n=1 Tax=Myotis myotis TaxID=51298 RepID=A0A7J7ZYJ0_MYOMY|nr:hypothetical protein mMyoMyo1_009695 [Myotis myotis]
MNSYFVPASPHPHPPLSQARAAGHLPLHLCPPLGQSSDRDPASQRRGTQPALGHLQIPWGSCSCPFKLIPTGLAPCSQCQKVLRKSGLRKAFLPWDSLGGGFLRMSFNVLRIMSLEILCRPYWWWWWWWWFLSLFLYLCLFPSFLSLFFFLVAGLP